MQQYLDLVGRILIDGAHRPSPHPTQEPGTRALMAQQLRFDLSDGFPLLTVRSLLGSWRAIVNELLWFLSGSSEVAWLHERGVHMWDQWATRETSGTFGFAEGNVGPLYGQQWRSFGATRRSDGTYADDGIDQIAALIRELRERPNSRRLMVTTWNPRDARVSWLAPCHGIFKCFVADDRLSMLQIQRSADVPVGVPFNIASYALLTMMLAQVVGLQPGELVLELADAHIYDNQIEGCRELLGREPRTLPMVKINPDVTDIFGFRFEDFELRYYHPHPKLFIPVET
jgi:thymidylate synthase